MGCKFKYADGRVCEAPNAEHRERWGFTTLPHCSKHKARYERQRAEREKVERLEFLRNKYRERKAILDKIEQGAPDLIKCEELQAIALDLLAELLAASGEFPTVEKLKKLYEGEIK